MEVIVIPKPRGGVGVSQEMRERCSRRREENTQKTGDWRKQGNEVVLPYFISYETPFILR